MTSTEHAARCGCESSFCAHDPGHCSGTPNGRTRMEYVGLICPSCAATARANGGGGYLREAVTTRRETILCGRASQSGRAERDGDLLAFPTPLGADIVNLGDDRWTERCDGCDGTGHLGRRVRPASGPCELCWGTGQAFFAFSSYDAMAALNVPVRFAAQRGPEFFLGTPWTREVR